MSLYTSPGLVLSGAEAAFPAGTPLIGYQDLTEASNVFSTTAAAGFPVTNLANSATHLVWRGSATTGYEYVSVVTNTADLIDYVGIARHNFGSAGIGVLVAGGNLDTFNKIVLHLDSIGSPAGILDSNTGGSAHTWTVAGNAQISGSSFKFGGASL